MNCALKLHAIWPKPSGKLRSASAMGVQMSSILPNFCPVHQGESVLQAERIPMKPGKFVSALPVKMCESIAFTHMVPWFLLGAIILNLAGRKCCPRLTRSRKVLTLR